MKTITTTHEIDATPEQVWDVLVDFESHERWNPFFARIAGTAEVGQTITITARKGDGDGMSFRPKVLEVVPNELLRWKGKLLVPGLFDGEHIYRLEAIEDDRTRLHHGENFGGILIPMMGKLLRETEEGFLAFNEALATEVHARAAQESAS